MDDCSMEWLSCSSKGRVGRCTKCGQIQIEFGNMVFSANHPCFSTFRAFIKSTLAGRRPEKYVVFRITQDAPTSYRFERREIVELDQLLDHSAWLLRHLDGGYGIPAFNGWN